MPASATPAACVYLRRVGSVAGRSVLPWPPGLFGRGGTACAQRECAWSVPNICVSKGVNGRGDGGGFPEDVKASSVRRSVEGNMSMRDREPDVPGPLKYAPKRARMAAPQPEPVSARGGDRPASQPRGANARPPERKPAAGREPQQRTP